jgi:hypothetical protein
VYFDFCVFRSDSRFGLQVASPLDVGIAWKAWVVILYCNQDAQGFIEYLKILDVRNQDEVLDLP